MAVSVVTILGFIVALVCTVLSLIFITPENKRASLNKFFQFIHDLFNFKFLILEMILKVLYIFSTLYCIALGFFLLFSGYNTGYFGYGSFHSTALEGLATMVLGPILVRIVYEAMMLFILLVNNTISINKKIKGDNQTDMKVDAPTMYSFENIKPEPQQDTPQQQKNVCPNCGSEIVEGSAFCAKCGTKL